MNDDEEDNDVWCICDPNDRYHFVAIKDGTWYGTENVLTALPLSFRKERPDFLHCLLNSIMRDQLHGDFDGFLWQKLI